MAKSLEQLLTSENLAVEKINRRKFIRDASLATTSLFVSSFIPSCSKNPVSSNLPETQEHEEGYETFNASTNSKGNIQFTNSSGEEISVHVQNENGKSLSGIEVKFYENSRMFITTKDQSKDYLPGFYHKNPGSRRLAKTTGLYDIINYLYNAYKFGDYAIKLLEDHPTFTKDHIINLPGIVYEGNWSFNEIKIYGSVLNSASTLLIPVTGGATTPIAISTSIFSELTNIADKIIDTLNSRFNMNIDKDKQYEFYKIPLLEITFFLPRAEYSKDIKDYISTDSRNWWQYTLPNFDLHEVNFYQYKDFNGKNVAGFKESNGAITYQDFDDNVFKTYGVDIPNIGLIKFSPPIVVGDDKLDFNKTYSTTTKYGGTSYQETHKYTWLGLEDVEVYAGNFKRCWKIKNEVSSDQVSATQYAWMAMDVGQAQVLNIEQDYIKLYRAYVNGKYYGSDLGKEMAKENGKHISTNLGLISLLNTIEK